MEIQSFPLFTFSGPHKGLQSIANWKKLFWLVNSQPFEQYVYACINDIDWPLPLCDWLQAQCSGPRCWSVVFSFTKNIMIETLMLVKAIKDHTIHHILYMKLQGVVYSQSLRVNHFCFCLKIIKISSKTSLGI